LLCSGDFHLRILADAGGKGCNALLKEIQFNLPSSRASKALQAISPHPALLTLFIASGNKSRGIYVYTCRCSETGYRAIT
jgi:hypothetical protein